MPVSVSLAELVTLAGACHLWPEEFASLVGAAEEAHAEQLRYAVIADWVDAVGEPEYAQAWRWLHKRLGTTNENGVMRLLPADPGRYLGWRFQNLPDSISQTKTGKLNRSYNNLAACVANLAVMLTELRNELL